MKDKLHIVSFDVPTFPLYGGTIDVYHKIMQLSSVFEIELHCFRKGNEVIDEQLKHYCKKVHYYNRQKGWGKVMSLAPYIVKTRHSKRLLDYLKSNPGKVLFEGIHTTSIAYQLDKDRLVLRAHNIEHDYYSALSSATKNLFKKLYYKVESIKLRKFEQKTFKYFSKVAAISNSDLEYISPLVTNTMVVYPFHGIKQSDLGKSFDLNSIVYFGNFSVEENENAAIELIRAAAGSKFSLKFLGSRFSTRLIKLCELNQIQIHHNPTDEELNEAIKTSEFTVLISNQATGIKLKLIRALHFSNKIILSGELDPDNLLKDYCLVSDKTSILNWIREDSIEYPQKLAQKNRRSILKEFSDQENGRKLIELING